MTPHRYRTPKCGFWAATGYAAWSLSGAIAHVMVVALPGQAAVLNDWGFDPNTRQLTLTLPENVTPNYFLLAEPARIVLNIPNTQVGNVATEQRYGGAIRSIRVSQFDASSTRIVVEFAPNTILDPRHAELSSTASSGGRRWVLHPLVVSSPEGSAIAVATPPTPATPSVTTSPAAATPDQTALPALPDTGTAAVVGAAAAVVPAPSPIEDLSTSARGLTDPQVGAPNDVPPDSLPIDPFAASTQPSVSVPSLAETEATPALTVAVPPLATVPTSPSPAVPEAPAAISPPPQSAPAAPLPATVLPPNRSEAVAPVDPLPAPPQALPPVAPLTDPRPPQPTGSRPEPPLTPAAPAPPAVPAPPVVASPPNSIPVPPSTAETPVVDPPFLTGTGTSPAERPSIPPPPPRPGDGAIPFGAPLPDQAAGRGGAIAAATTAVPPGLETALPIGTRLKLRYPGTVPLVLEQPEPFYEVLLLAEDVVDPQTGRVLIPAQTPVMGRFEGLDNSGRRFVAQVILPPQGDRQPVLAESDWLVGVSQARGNNILVNSGIGAVAFTVLTGLSGAGLIGGAAIGAAAAYATAPQVVTIQPGQIIEAEIVSDILPFHGTP